VGNVQRTVSAMLALTFMGLQEAGNEVVVSQKVAKIAIRDTKFERSSA
jgi:hypothetical protein